jgi:hypothetical protein
MVRREPMSIRNKAAIVAIGETPTDRLGSKPGEPRKSSAQYLSWAMQLAFEDAGLRLKDFQGQGLGVTIRLLTLNLFGLKKSLKFSALRRAFFSAAPPAALERYHSSARWLRRSARV